jgi:pimeloyl-ACP methyl ester carboxylesterase
MQFETSSGNTLYYEEFGAPDAPAVLLVHGSTLTGRQDFCVHSDLAAAATAHPRPCASTGG